jgi:CubicO group peptidase (beta-lactamase class C family)
MRRLACLPILAVVAFAFPLPSPAAAQLRGYDAYVSAAVRAWGIPGLAVAVVQGDSVVFARGFGVRRLGDAAPVTERTLFAIASCTKAFTAAALAMLVDSAKLAWDDPATKYLKGFQLYDPYVTRELTVRDLLSHRSGLARGDGVWWATPYDRVEVLRRVRYLEPSWSFRSRYGYQNIMFAAAGEIVPAVARKTWDEFVRARIFAPLGMTTTTTSVAALPSGPTADVASPHQTIGGRMQPIPYRNVDNIGPAGSINSSAIEMAQWIRLQLGGGVYRGRRLLSADRIKEMHSAQTVIPLDTLTERLRPSTHFLAYGLGWSLSDYRGRKLVSHGGALDGMRSIVMLVPEERLGIVVLTNGGEPGRLLTSAVALRVVDSYLGTPVRDWSAELLAVYRAQAATDSVDEEKEKAKRVPGTRPSLAAAGYAGTYSSDMYGDVTVAVEGAGLVMRFGPEYTGDLAHWHYDTYQAVWRNPVMGKDLITFTLGADGAVARLAWPSFGDFERKVPPPAP